MTKWADFCISKLSLNDGLIDTIIVCSDNGNDLGIEEEKTRDWLVKQVTNGKTFCSIRKNIKGKWTKIGDGSYIDDRFKWYVVPENLPKRKAFVSYYHKDDEDDRKAFENLFDDLVTSKSVEIGDIDPDNSDQYTKMLIQNNNLHDTTILIVLIGRKTKCRKHIDWELSGALDYRVGDKYAGILGIFLPSHPNFGSEKYTPDAIPRRLYENVKSGYAVLMDWTDDRMEMQKRIEHAIANRAFDGKIVNKEIPQMTQNECE